MNKKTKLLITVLCIVLVLTSAVVGSIAYLIDREEVVNTFTVGDVGIKLTETKVNTDGSPVVPPERTEEGNLYHLVPGQTYVKDPTITVDKGSEESYIRMLVTINKASELKAILGDDFKPENYVASWDPEIWPCTGITENGDNTVTYEFRYYKTVSARDSEEDVELEPLFTSFTLPGDAVNGQQLATIQGLEISVVGNAIQSVSLENADAAWAAFDDQYAAESGNP